MVGGSRQKTAAQKKKNLATCGAGGTMLQGRQHSGLLVTHHGHSLINGNLSYHNRMEAEANTLPPVLQPGSSGPVQPGTHSLDDVETKKHKEKSLPTENLVTSPLVTADFSACMKSRRENIFASLVGHRVTLRLRNSGGVISGLFCLYGNQQLLPSNWSDVKPNASPAQDNCSVCVGGELGAAIAVSQEENGWKLVASSSAGSTARRRRGIQSQSEQIIDEGGSARGSRPAKSCYFFEFETYSKHTEKSTKDWKTFLWLRSAYRLPDGDRKSSNIYEWLGVDWSEIALMTAENIPDSSDAAVRTRRERVSAHGNAAHTGTFQTDAEILEKTLNKNSSSPILFEKRLQKWTDGGDPVGQDDILFWPVEPIGGGSDGSGKGQGLSSHNAALGVCSWDQFEENEKTFGVKSTYVDGMYSTTLIMSEIPDEVQKRAQKLAEEMESSQRGRNPGRSHSRDAAAPGPHSRWRRFNDRDSHSVYTKLEGDNCSYVDEDDEEGRFSAVLPVSTETRNRVSAQIKDRGAAVPPLPRASKQQVSNIRGISGANLPTGTNTSRWPAFSSNSSGANVRSRNRGYFAGGGDSAEADAGKFLKVQPEAGGEVVAQEGLVTHQDESQTRHSLSPPNQWSGRPYQLKPTTGGWDESSSYVQKTTTRPPALESQRISTGQEGNPKAPRSVKDNINALNLEPIRSRHQYVIGIPQTVGVGVSEGRHPVLNVQDKKRIKKAEFLKALTEIQNRMARKGWNLAQPVSGAVTVGGGSSPAKGPPHRKATISPASKDELSRVLHSTLRPTPAVAAAAEIPDPDISRGGATAAGTFMVGKPAPPADRTAMSVAEKLEEKPKIVDELEAPEAAGGVAYTAEERLMAAKRMFQFNPNANSFTPKEPASEGVVTTGKKRVFGANGVASTFEAIDPQVLENRQRERSLAKGQAHESSGGIESFVASIRLAAKSCGTSDLMRSPDWSPCLPISYMDLMDFEVIDSLSATSALVEPVANASRTLCDNGYGVLVQQDPVVLPQGLSHEVAENPHAAQAPPQFLPFTPALLNNMNLQANPSNANLRFALIPGGGISLCESSVIGLATSGLGAAAGPYGGSSFIPFGTPQQFLTKSVTPQQAPMGGQANSAPLTPTELNVAAGQFGPPVMYGFPGPSIHHTTGRIQPHPIRVVHPHEGTSFVPTNPNNTQPPPQIQQPASGNPNGQNAQFMSPFMYPTVGSGMMGEHVLAEHRSQGDDGFVGGGGGQASQLNNNPASLAWYPTPFALSASQQQQQMFACLAAQQQQQQAMFNQQAAYFYNQQAAQVNDIRASGLRGGAAPSRLGEGTATAAIGSGNVASAKPAGATPSLSCV